MIARTVIAPYELPIELIVGITNETADGMPGITFVAAVKYDLYNETLTLTMLDGQNPFAEGKTQLQLNRLGQRCYHRFPA